MDNFIVSARKYRPTTFDSVVGQHAITSTLKNAIKSSHLAQAFLFCGPRGVGKTTCARILAKTINCFDLTKDIEACDQCDSCKSFNEGRSLNINELDGASNNGVDEIRNLIEQVRFAPQIGSHKVYIIDEVHMLSQAAFNAFLKTLEEPPKHAIFILATTEKHKIIPTILSRCQIFDFNRIQIDDIAKHLGKIAVHEKVKAEEEGLHIIAQKADGALRDALSMFDQIVSFTGGDITYKDVIQNLNILDYDYYFKIMASILEGDISNCLILFDEILNNGFDGHNFINGLSQHFRNLLVCQDEKTVQLLELGSTVKQKYIDQSQQSNVDQLIGFLSLTNQTDIHYKSSKNQRLSVELMLMQLCSNRSFEDKKKVQPIKISKPEPPKKPFETTEKKEKSVDTYQPTEPNNLKVEEDPVSYSNIKKETENTPNKSPEKTVLKNTDQIHFSDSISINSFSIKQDDNSSNNTTFKSDLKEVYSNEQFRETWKKYQSKLEEEGRASLATIFDNSPKIENDLIEIVVENKALEDEFKSQQADFIEYIRKNLSNYTINVVTRVNKDEKMKKAYTPQEKFMKMAEKNPNLKQLKSKLDMDVDYA